MATTSKILSRAAASTSSAILYTAPTSTTAIVTNIAVANTASSSATFTLSLGGVAIHSGTTISANSTVYIDLKQVLTAGMTITGLASAVTVNFHISGVEVN